MKKEIVHFSWLPWWIISACGCERKRFVQLKITDIRNKVTCKRCKATKRFRKIK